MAATSECENKRVIFAKRLDPNDVPKEEHFKIESCPYPSNLASNEVLVKTLFLSVDPAMRCRMNKDTGVDYIQPLEVGKTVEGFGGIGIVITSKSSSFKEGDIVTMGISWPWQNYVILNDAILQKVEKSLVGERISLILSYLGLTGLTVLLGIREKGHIKYGKNQTFVVSGAAGACGHLAGQIARLDGCERIIGICGSDEKCKFLIDQVGFDGVINYKQQNVDEKLKVLCPNGIQVYFDNVGGEISNSVIKQMTEKSHVILCGQISQYNKDVPYPPPIPEDILKILNERKITRERFLILDYAEKFEDSLQILANWLRENKIKIFETIEEGLENAPRGFINMMIGRNIGKQLIHVADP